MPTGISAAAGITGVAAAMASEMIGDRPRTSLRVGVKADAPWCNPELPLRQPSSRFASRASRRTRGP